jgi:hypothetical protein
MTISDIADCFYGNRNGNIKKNECDKIRFKLHGQNLINSESMPHLVPKPSSFQPPQVNSISESIMDKSNDIINNSEITHSEITKKEEIRNDIECDLEIYHCKFCNYKYEVQHNLEDHYFECHEKEVRNVPGTHINNKVHWLIENGEKSYIKHILRLDKGIIECVGDKFLNAP